MKTIIWETPHKMEIHTGHKTFDKKCLTLSKGNVCSPTQTSRYIRPKTETQCNFRNFPEGTLRDADLEIFTKSQPCIPDYVLKCVLKETETKPICLYRIFHCIGEKRITHGWILTQSHEKDHELIAVFLSDSRRKTFAIMDEAVRYVSNPQKN